MRTVLKRTPVIKLQNKSGSGTKVAFLNASAHAVVSGKDMLGDDSPLFLGFLELPDGTVVIKPIEVDGGKLVGVGGVYTRRSAGQLRFGADRLNIPVGNYRVVWNDNKGWAELVPLKEQE